MKLKSLFTFSIILISTILSFSQPTALESILSQSYDEDTDTYVPDGRERFVVDINKIYMAVYYENLVNEEWVPFVRTEYTYNSQGLLESEIFSIMDPMTGNYSEATKGEHMYDSNGNIVKRSWSFYDPVNEIWDLYNTLDYTYDSNGNQIEKQLTAFDALSGTYLIEYKEVQTYYPNGRLKDNIYFDYDNGVWDPVSKYENTFNSSNYLTSTVQYGSYDGSSDFYLSYKEDYQYDANGYRILKIGSGWDDVEMDWSPPTSKEESENTNAYTIIHTYNWYDEAWLPEDRSTFTYEPGFNGEAVWPYFDLTEFENLELEYFDNLLRSKLLTVTTEEWDSNTSSYLKEYKTVYNWDSETSSIEEENSIDISIRPNPASDFIIVDMKDLPKGRWNLTISNEMGQKVQSISLLSKEELNIDVSNLPIGIYQLSMFNGVHYKTKSIVIH